MTVLLRVLVTGICRFFRFSFIRKHLRDLMIQNIYSYNSPIVWKIMPKRTDIKKILIIGSGPIVIGQACEFDYSGSQAGKALREEGYEVVLINSNPATIMTDPEMADRTYIEPVTPEIVAKIIEKERPDALLPTLGGQTGLNTAVAVAEMGVLEKFGVEMIGADLKAIKKAEDRQQFKDAMKKAKIDLPRSGTAKTWKQAEELLEYVKLPAIIRPSFTLGGTGSGIDTTEEEYERIVKYGQELSPTHEVLIEEDLTGWKEFELEVMRDKNDNVVIVCSIENFDAMGIHTGDSITVAPAQTLTDKEYQIMRDASIRCIREIGVETGGSNIQFAVNTKDGRMIIIEMNQLGFSDCQIAHLQGKTEDEIKKIRVEQKIFPVYKLVDTCAAEFPAYTPYYYSTYESECESKPSKRKKVLILGGGPNRIGQGIEFDYCCCHASFALREEGIESIMVNSNPETVSTDYDTSDKLYFEPLTKEDVVHIIEKEKPDGIIVQFGGQTPLNLAFAIEKAGGKIIGTSPKSIDRAEDRQLFQRILKKLKLRQPANGMARSYVEAKKVAKRIGYPVLVRPSYVLGGRAMEIVYDDKSLEQFMGWAVDVSPEHPILVDKFLEDALEVDVDAVSDGKKTVVCGIMEHIEEAGIHSGDSACAIPPFSLSEEMIEEIKKSTYALAKELKVKGLMNIQYAVQGDTLYVLEVNPRASRTVPFVSKATGIPWAKIATKVMIGKTLKQLGIEKEVEIDHVAVKEAVFPFNRFPGADAVLGPEMKSTGEVMGIDSDYGRAFMKAQIAAGQKIPLSGQIFVSVKNKDKRSIILIAKRLVDLGYSIVATAGTGKVLTKNGVAVKIVAKIHEEAGSILDLLNRGEIAFLINTPGGKKTKIDEAKLRPLAVMHNVPLITTISGARATVNGLDALKKKGFDVKALQDYHRKA